jgi:DNA-binding NarL/FixJ family response regulator
MTRVLIADDHPLLREALCQVFSSQRDMEIVGEACDGEEAVDLVSQLKPDIVVMDIMMPKFDGLEASKRIKKLAPNTAVLILTAYDDDSYVLGLLEAGAAGYLLKSARGQDLVDAVRAIRAGESVLHPHIIEQLLKRTEAKSTGTLSTKINKVLTDREMEILKLLAKGMSNKEIAEKSFLSLRTVKTHMSNIFAKMSVASRSEALAEALRLGLLTLEDVKQ